MLPLKSSGALAVFFDDDKEVTSAGLAAISGVLPASASMALNALPTLSVKPARAWRTWAVVSVGLVVIDGLGDGGEGSGGGTQSGGEDGWG